MHRIEATKIARNLYFGFRVRSNACPSILNRDMKELIFLTTQPCGRWCMNLWSRDIPFNRRKEKR